MPMTSATVGAANGEERGEVARRQEGEVHAVPRLQIVPYRHSKIIHLIRHGQGFHNVAGHADPENYKSFEFLDSHLNDFGWKQAWALNKHIRSLGSTFRADVVIVSPLTRTLETAAGVFGAGRWQEGDPQPPLMLEQTEVPGKRAAQKAISSTGCPPFVAWEGCREHLGQHPCDKRRPISQIAPAFPAVDFSLIESDEDVLWRSADWRESHNEIRQRGVKFMNLATARDRRFLMGRQESHIAVLSHGGFLFHCLRNYGRELAGPVMLELHNCGCINAQSNI